MNYIREIDCALAVRSMANPLYNKNLQTMTNAKTKLNQWKQAEAEKAKERFKDFNEQAIKQIVSGNVNQQG